MSSLSSQPTNSMGVLGIVEVRTTSNEGWYVLARSPRPWLIQALRLCFFLAVDEGGLRGDSPAYARKSLRMRMLQWAKVARAKLETQAGVVRLQAEENRPQNDLDLFGGTYR